MRIIFSSCTPLDSNQGLVQHILARHGLAPETAQLWVQAVEELRGDPDALVAALVTAKEGTR